MNIKISKQRINSFVGDVLPIWLESDVDIRYEKIAWSVHGLARIRSFANEKGGFSHGVLVSLLAPGDAVVTAKYNGVEYSAKISVCNREHNNDSINNYYLADLHDHTSTIHIYEDFVTRKCGFQRDYIDFLKKEDKMDLSVISDHAEVVDAWEFFKGFIDAERAKPMKTVILPGCESEIVLVEKDRYGIEHRNSGEIVTLNADNYAMSDTFENFYDKMSTSPAPICILAHPQIAGYSVKGVWDFCLSRHSDEALINLLSLVELGNGTARESNILNEYVYSVALDNGYRVTMSCSSDSHEAPWGYDACPGKTIVMAPDATKESLIDAILSLRAYACESGNIKLYYTVNGVAAPCDLQACDTYKFDVYVDYFRADITSVPVSCQVISDYGKVVYETRDADFSSFSFTVNSGSARWFYLRFVDALGRRTLSVPVFTGRPIDPRSEYKYMQISKAHFTAIDLISGCEASNLINDDPTIPWFSKHGSADIIIDMGIEQDVRAIGHYPPLIIREAGVDLAEKLASLVAEYEISLSSDGVTYRVVADGFIRIYGNEVKIPILCSRARYVRFKAKSNVGSCSGRTEYFNSGLAIGELTVFQ